jgi:hypothetical protein
VEVTLKAFYDEQKKNKAKDSSDDEMELRPKEDDEDENSDYMDDVDLDRDFSELQRQNAEEEISVDQSYPVELPIGTSVRYNATEAQRVKDLVMGSTNMWDIP